MLPQDERWFATRCVIRFDRSPPVFEERITLWRASSFEEAVAKGERDAQQYASDLSGDALNLVQAYDLATGERTEGVEAFSLMRTSTLDPDPYLGRFFDTGDERQRPL